jgi:putative transposase
VVWDGFRGGLLFSFDWVFAVAGECFFKKRGMNFHRNSQQRFYDDELTYVVTVNVDGKIPYFQEKIFCELWIEELRICKELKKFELYGFCLNHDHFHMIVNPVREFNVSKVMQTFKKNVSQDINKVIGFYPEGENSNSRLQRIDFFKYRKQLIKKYKGGISNFPKFKWQSSFHDHYIRDEKDFNNQADYVIYNFLKHGLPENWKYTSLNFPELLDLP